MSKSNTRAIIDANIRQNGQQLITGQVLNATLNEMVTDYAEQAALDAFKEKVDALALGAFYGYFPDSSSLPVDITTPGYAYVGLDNPYKIWNFNGKSWSDSGTSIDMNDADEEDITRNADGKLQFKDRTYGDGMGYTILRKDKTFAEQVTQANTIYEIRYNFDLSGESINLPKNSTLYFDGGRIYNGILVGDVSKIVSINSEILPNIIMTGTWNVNCAYPNWFGAKGNNTTDDTDAVRLALYNCVTNNIPLVFPQGYIFYVTDAINYFDGEYKSYRINIFGEYPARIGGYAPIGYGGIRLSDNINLFANASISGSITNMGVFGVRSNNVHFFDKCTLNQFVLENSSIGNIGIFLHDTGLTGVTHIRNNIFLSCFYFHKNTERATTIVDSAISYNYINGGAEPVDNSCFEFTNGNGSIIDHNFIDYYRTIFNVNNSAESSTITCALPLSIANEYQVFRYFYTKINVSSLVLESVGDVFNWTDPSKLAKLQTYLPIKEDVTIANVDVPMDLPPYIAFLRNIDSIVMRDIKLEQNVGIPFYIWSEITDYVHSKFELSFSQSRMRLNLLDITKNQSIYSNGQYRQNKVSISGIDIITDTLPSLTLGWGHIPNGLMVLCDNIRYTSNIIYNPESQSWRFSWVDELGNEFGKQKAGTTAQRPGATKLIAGETYFDTTINKMIVWNGSAWVNMDGSNL